MSVKRKIDWANLLDDVPPAEDRFLDKCTDVGNQIYALMKERGMSQRDLAGAAGKSESYVSRLLAGGVNVTMRTVTEFEEALGADVLVAPMYSHKSEEKPARTLRKVTETQRYASFDVAGYEKVARGLKGAGFDMPSHVLPAPNQTGERLTHKQSLARAGGESVETVFDEDPAVEMMA